MNLIVDLHIHSHYSRATSKDLTLEQIYKWGKIKGINVIGTGDFTHPKWYEDLQSRLEYEESSGLYKLKEEWSEKMDREIPASCRDNTMRFVLTVEIANIYKRGGKVRRLHNVVVAPNLETAARINARLQVIGNLHSDGRPMLGLDSEELLKITLDADERCMLIPAHIWTPWFAMFGSKSGFDSLEEAFGENKKYIYAVETGLSADPEMCRRLAQLDGVALVSNSDAHSCAKLGREATILSCETVSYEQIVGAIKTGDERLAGTIEFYPEEGKYHEDGHANCGFSCDPTETEKLGGKCPRCGQGLTIGVLSRVRSLADQVKTGGKFKDKLTKYIVPLPEIIMEVEGVKSAGAGKAVAAYGMVTEKLGSDFEVLLETPIEKIKAAGFERLGEAIEKVRKGDIYIKPGYDGIFGKVAVWGSAKQNEGEKKVKAAEGQIGLF